MSDAPADRPRSWVPFVAAAAVGAVVLVGAILASVLTGGPDETEAAAIAACEAGHEASGDPEIVGGEIYDPSEWRDHYAVVETHAQVPTPLADLSAEAEAAFEARADDFAESGAGEIVVVWRLTDDSYRQCVAPVADGGVDPELAAVGPLQVRGEALEE